MHHFTYRNGQLHAEAVDLTTIAEAIGTPFYCYASATIERHYKVFAGAFADVDALVCYALKANSNKLWLRHWQSSAPARMSSPAANCCARGPPACRRRTSCFPESARPRPNWRLRSTRTFFA